MTDTATAWDLPAAGHGLKGRVGDRGIYNLNVNFKIVCCFLRAIPADARLLLFMRPYRATEDSPRSVVTFTARSTRFALDSKPETAAMSGGRNGRFEGKGPQKHFIFSLLFRTWFSSQGSRTPWLLEVASYSDGSDVRSRRTPPRL